MTDIIEEPEAFFVTGAGWSCVSHFVYRFTCGRMSPHAGCRRNPHGRRSPLPGQGARIVRAAFPSDAGARTSIFGADRAPSGTNAIIIQHRGCLVIQGKGHQGNGRPVQRFTGLWRVYAEVFRRSRDGERMDLASGRGGCGCRAQCFPVRGISFSTPGRTP